MRATIIYHLASGRIVREPAEVPDGATPDEYRDALLRNLAEVLIQPATKVTKASLVPLVTVTDDNGRDHLIVTANLEDLELVLEP